MIETDNFSSDWSELFDDIPDKTELVLSPYVKPAIAGAATSGDIPISSNFASTNKSSAKSGGSGATSNSQGSSNNGNKKRFPWWTLLILCLIFGGTASAIAGYNPVYRALRVVGIEGIAGKDGQDGADGIDGKDGINGISSLGTSTPGADGAAGQNGANGNDGAAGANGSNGSPGADGADGADGTNACISGLCVSRQTTSPATQESGNINIDGKVLATQIGINDTTPSNTLTVGGTVDVSGHSAFGGETVDGYTNGSDGLSGTSSNSTTMIVVEELTSITGSGMNRQALATGLVLNPGAAPVYNQMTGVGGGVEIASGNTQNFTGNLSGYGGGFIHSGTGAVTFASSYNAGMLNLSTGTITTANAFNSNVINLNAGGTLTNAHGLQASVINLGTITNNYGVKINTPTNSGTVTNNYGLYVADQSSVGSSITQNIYSAGVTSNNFFQGFVGIGSIAGPLDGQVHIVNDGSGNSFKVSDTAYADTSPFVIDSSGKVGVRTATPGTNNSVFEVTGSAYVSDYVYTSMLRSTTETNSKIDLYDSSNGIAFIAQNDTKDFRWGINGGADLMTLDGATGRLGLGTTTPSAELDISQNATWITELLLSHTTSGKTLTLGTTGNATNSWNIHNAYGELFIYNTSLSSPSIEFADNGGVGIGTNFAAPGAKLHVKETSDTSVLRLEDSDGTCDHNPESGSETVSCSSDARLKTNIQDAASVLSEINGLKIRDYTVIASGSQTTGLIAQEVMQTNPEMVHMGADGFYKVDSYNSWKLLKGIQELSSNADNLNATFTDALVKANGDITKTNYILSSLGLKVDTLSETMQELADRLNQVESSVSTQSNDIASLKAEIQALKLQLNSN